MKGLSKNELVIIKKCLVCKKNHRIEVTEKQLIMYRSGKIPFNLKIDDRELLISSICGPCFDNMFGGDEE